MGEYLKSELKLLLSGHHGNPHSDIEAQKVPTNRAPHFLQVDTTNKQSRDPSAVKGRKRKEKGHTRVLFNSIANMVAYNKKQKHITIISYEKGKHELQCVKNKNEEHKSLAKILNN